MSSSRHDVIVVGGGPSGSTIANLLAARKHDVLLVEREVFPRFHIGESLLPCDLPIFEKLGISLEGQCLKKRGAEFIDEATGETSVFDFNDALPGDNRYAWQVERSVFDELLLDRAAAVGAIVHQGERVLTTRITGDEVAVTTDRDSYRARFLVDATGQDALLARQSKTVEPWDGFGRAAVFCHFTDIAEPIWDEIQEKGNIKILLVPDGWIWIIPLLGRKLSVGIVTRGKGFEPALLDGAIKSSPLIQKLTRGASRTEARVIRNFSFKNHTPFGSRFLCVGDSAAFLDPVFSTGVSLGMLASEHASGILSDALAASSEHRGDLMADHCQWMGRAYRSFGSLVHSFYHRKLVENLFFGDDNRPEVRASITSLLAGDVWRDDNWFQQALANSSPKAVDPSPFTQASKI